jgi:short-subunit dehydrogenase involved in D-alanine esterification of teichoic acids
MNITGNTIFIPGSTSGIGEALAIALYEKGNTVIVGGRRDDQLARLAEQHPGLDTVVIDTADPVSISAAAHTVLSRHPDLNVVVTMAGIMRTEDWTTSDSGFLRSAESTVTTNVLGPIRLIAAFIDHLRAQPDSTIMTVSSGLGFAPLKVTPSYNASKAAVHMLSESLRLQLAETSVRVIELVPPSVRTNLLPGQQDNAVAMPLDDFINEVMTLLDSEPEAHEILVDRVKFLRFGEARGDYGAVVEALNASDPHASGRE